ncbi:MAG: hypothetical protein SPF36_09540 [Lachnospiraceae bacterium]|nr:hypothetical protein [Lachnospiraceae bacterium]MDY3254391.1 hypothetical protein [Lachnospiraceae bacterium]MDY5641332.1 hypothetical protein [Lachnospiraceae bacterium]
MSKLILCKGKLSKNPYYIVGLGMNVYSIEELCYYFVKDAYILDNDIMDLGLCDFIADELELTEIAEALRSLILRGASLGQFVTSLLEMTGYLEEEELLSIKQVLVDNASLSFAMKRKKRADNLLEAKKFTRAIDEYRYMLNRMKKSEDPEMYSLILHNTGVAYARLFMYDKASYYFKEATALNDDKEILIHYLQSLRMTMKKDAYERFVLRMGYPDSIIRETEERLSLARSEKSDSEYAKEIEEIRELRSDGHISEYYNRIDETFVKWKLEYRDRMIARSAR